MFTRIEKYAQYREEIANNSKFQIILNSDSAKINKYNAEINKINKNILSFDEYDLELKIESMIQKNESFTETPKQIVDSVNKINSMKLTMTNDEINSFFSKINNDSILNDDKCSFKNSWIYSENIELKNLLNKINIINNNEKDSDLKKEIVDKFNIIFKENKQEIKVLKSEQIKNNGNAVFYSFFISAGIIIFLILIMTILVCIKLILM